MKRLSPFVPVAAFVACRFGGPSADPQAYVPSDASVEAASEDAAVTEGDDAAVAPDEAGQPAMADDDATSVEASFPDSGAGVDGGVCTGTVAVCDPVHNTGCNPLQQCDVDTTQTSKATGLCVFNSGADGGAAASCTMSIVSESCPPGNTCTGGVCRALCFCNANCPVGKCCSDTSGPQGFTLCGPCP